MAKAAGVRIDEKRIASHIRRWLANPMDPDRRKIEAIDKGAFKAMGRGWEAWRAVTQRPVEGLIAVTSLSPNPRHQVRQPVCVDSWRRTGLRVVSVNTSEEAARLRELYPEVEFVERNDQGCFYTKPTQLVNNMAEMAILFESAVLLINSDIEIYGDQEVLTRIAGAKRCAIGIRHNYEGSPGDARQEPWGLDAIILHPEHAKMLDRVPYSIGRPFWDYWLPWALMNRGVEMDWIGAPYFYHQTHELNWSQGDWIIGSQWFEYRYGAVIDWVEWRESLPFPPSGATKPQIKQA